MNYEMIPVIRKNLKSSEFWEMIPVIRKKRRSGEYDEVINDGLPPIVNLAYEMNDIPALAQPLIDGVLRCGHKMLLAGPSKAGKSYALVELCCSIAEGREWLGSWPCTQGRVLYVNLELDRASCLHRFKDVYDALGWQPKNLQNIDVWNLRGKSVPMDKLAPKLIRRAMKKNYIAIIIDPIYKVITGDENSATAMAEFFSYFDQIGMETGSAVIYCHHHSKGDQSWKRSMDRASGSGVFARDPDAILDVTELELPAEQRQENTTAWRITGTLREFAAFPPVDVWFNSPLHVVAHFNPDEVAPHHELTAWRRAMNGRKSKDEKLRERNQKIEQALNSILADGKEPTISTLAEYMGVSSVNTVRRMVDENDHLTRENGVVRWV